MCGGGHPKAAREKTGRCCEGERAFNRLDEALEYWIDMIWCNYSLFLSSFNTLAYTLLLSFSPYRLSRPATSSSLAH
jgi:hypothetical protein